jgi:dynein heavy chain
MRAMLRDEFLITMQKFINHIDLTIRQIEGEVRLRIPSEEVTDEFRDRINRRLRKSELAEDMKHEEEDEALVQLLETTVYEWEAQIAQAIEVQNRRLPKDNGPLAEIDYWKERNISLSGVFEQTKQEKVKQILECLAGVENPAASSFEHQRLDLSKLYSEAKDNVRFLSTLERHFKNICYGSSFHVVAETLPSMMNALRMIWIISRHYNKDERMVPLMERIAHELTERVAKVINVRKILDMRPQDIQKLCTEARKMLTQWKDAYFKVRAKIEASGRDSRWEFDRRKLFDKTEHQALICNELIKISVVLEEFYNIFGNELKAVTGEPKHIEEVLTRVRNLVTRIKTVR